MARFVRLLCVMPQVFSLSHKYTCICINMYTHGTFSNHQTRGTHTCAYWLTCAYTQACTFASPPPYPNSHGKHLFTHMYKYKYIYTLTPISILTYVHTHTHIHTHTHTTHTHSHSLTHSRMYIMYKVLSLKLVHCLHLNSVLLSARMILISAQFKRIILMSHLL